jgi:hypothetical protein
MMEKESHLYILWTTDNPITAMNMIMTYGGNSLLKGWWDKVTIIIWGAADHLVATDPDIQARIKEMIYMGAHFTACKRCAQNLGVEKELLEMGIEVKFWGEALTKLLKSGATILTV